MMSIEDISRIGTNSEREEMPFFIVKAVKTLNLI
jgi:hypothetical protein